MASLSLLHLFLLTGFASASASDKRGLVYTPNADFPQDNQVWVQSGSDLTWYYNYQAQPSAPYNTSLSQQQFEFVPMMWGVSGDLTDTTFLNQVKTLIDQGTNITHVLGFNEPDGSTSTGGSGINPKDAAQAWVANFEPLGELGIKLGLPACTGGPDSLPWLKQFLANCSAIVSTENQRKNCTWDFLPVHWYDNFAGLASLIGERRATWPDANIWVTEYAFANQDLQTTQEFFNQTLDYFGKLDYIARYTYFGAFRSKTSNVGPNAPFLNNAGKLTDIGSWYLGFSETNVSPTSSASLSTEIMSSWVVGGVGLVVAYMNGLV
ncbi:glycoside hydrolase family 128 protein [Trichoderma ceciliae]